MRSLFCIASSAVFLLVGVLAKAAEVDVATDLVLDMNQKADVVWKTNPRPQLRRESPTILNGTWEYWIVDKGQGRGLWPGRPAVIHKVEGESTWIGRRRVSLFKFSFPFP